MREYGISANKSILHPSHVHNVNKFNKYRSKYGRLQHRNLPYTKQPAIKRKHDWSRTIQTETA